MTPPGFQPGRISAPNFKFDVSGSSTTGPTFSNVNLFLSVYVHMRKYRQWTDVDLANAVVNSNSIANVLRTLNLKPTGGNYLNIKKNIIRLNLDINHFINDKCWNRGKFFPLGKLKGNSAIKKFLLRNRGNQCENCKLTTWKTNLIPLEIHHIDGNRMNNTEENLQLLCPNCHALTDNWRNRKRNN